MSSTDHVIQEPFDDPPEIGGHLQGLVAAAHAVGLQDHKRLLEMNARNVERSWRMGMDALGWKREPAEDDEEMGGDVNVSGDTHIHVVPQAQRQEQKPTPLAPITESTSGNRLLPWLLAAGITAANAGAGYWLINNLPTTQPPTDQRTTIGLETE